MSKKSCTGCYFYGNCSGRKICGGYTPLTDEGEEFEVNLAIRKGRNEFRKEWNEYIDYIREPHIYESTLQVKKD